MEDSKSDGVRTQPEATATERMVALSNRLLPITAAFIGISGLLAGTISHFLLLGWLRQSLIFYSISLILSVCVLLLELVVLVNTAPAKSRDGIIEKSHTALAAANILFFIIGTILFAIVIIGAIPELTT